MHINKFMHEGVKNEDSITYNCDKVTTYANDDDNERSENQNGEKVF